MSNKIDTEKLSSDVRTAIREKIEPSLAGHFGGAKVTEITQEGVVYIKMTGTCGTCPAAEEELSGTIRSVLMSECPDITDVRLDQRLSEDILDFAKKLLSKDH